MKTSKYLNFGGSLGLLQLVESQGKMLPSDVFVKLKLLKKIDFIWALILLKRAKTSISVACFL